MGITTNPLLTKRLGLNYGEIAWEEMVSKAAELVYRAIPGGSCYNVAIASARQGQKVSYITPISRDSLGNILAGRLEADKVIVSAPRVDEPTSLAVVSVIMVNPAINFTEMVLQSDK